MEEILPSTNQTKQASTCDEQTLQTAHGDNVKGAAIIGTGMAVCFAAPGAVIGTMSGMINKKDVGKNAGIGAGAGAGVGLLVGSTIGALKST